MSGVDAESRGDEVLALELRNCPLYADLRLFGGGLVLAPIAHAQERMRRNWRTGRNVITVSASLNMRALRGRLCADDHSIVFGLTELLSFASRRGVTFRWPAAWGHARKLIMRGGVSSRGPVDQTAELARLIEVGLPRLLDEHVNTATKCRTGLRWFLGWELEPYVDMRFVRLWMVIEMLSRAWWEGKPGDPKGKLSRAKAFAVDIGLPDVDDIPLKEMNLARNALVHGDVDEAGLRMWTWFGHLAESRDKQLHVGEEFWRRLGMKDIRTRPQEPSYSRALFEAAFVLSRVLEKVFLALLDTRHCWFFKNADYIGAWAP